MSRAAAQRLKILDGMGQSVRIADEEGPASLLLRIGGEFQKWPSGCGIRVAEDE
jgi:hypothetical protein